MNDGAAPLALDERQALAFRLERQGLGTQRLDTATALARLLGAQAQVHSAGVLQLRARSRDATAAGILAGLAGDGRLVKLWAQRSTLHIIGRDDLAAVIALRRHFIPAYDRWLEQGGITAEQRRALVDAIVGALAEGPMTRAELTERLTPALGEWARPWLAHSWGGAIKLVATMGLVVHGPERPRETSFAALPPLPEHDPEAALRAWARRYFAAFGPAGSRDLAKFTGLPAPAVHRLIAALRPELVPVSLAGRPVWALAEDEPALRAAEMTPGAIAVLPHFDPYLLAHHSSDIHMAPKLRPLIYRTAGWISPVVLKEGRVAATWSQRRAGDRWLVDAKPVSRLGKRDWKAAEQLLAHLAGAVGVTDIALGIGERA